MKATKKVYFNRMTDEESQAIHAFLVKLEENLADSPLSVVMFGSRARGTAADDSDMDLLVVFPKVDAIVRDKVRDLATEVLLDYGIYLSTRVWSETYRRRLAQEQSMLYQNIQRDGIELLELVN